jgi:hypothetical protein
LEKWQLGLACPPEQASFGRLLTLRRAVRQYVADVERPRPQMAADQMQPVTIQRIALAAHQRHRLLGEGVHQLLDPPVERRFAHACPVVEPGLRRIVPHRLAAELLAQEQVPHALVREDAREPLLAEVRDEARIRPGAHVGDRFDPVAP